MLDLATLKSGLERLREGLEKNILERSQDEPSVAEDLRHRYEEAKTAKRTGLAFEIWRDNEITQAAVAWLLGCVFVRFLEDNQLIEQSWISGPPDPGRNRLAEAKEHNLETYRAGLHQTDRDYLLLCFKEMAKLPGVAALFYPEHNPLYQLSPTGHGARALIDFFQRTAGDGKTLLLDFTGTVDNTRFLGDLYQDISESARKRYALVQTPDFVVDFVLDRTMTPALEEFGVPGFRIIDPACGSGHFLLAAFERLFARWQKHAPDLDAVEHVNRALGSIFGVDLNPFAIAIARFRLLIAALRACDVKQLRDNFDFKTNLAVGDSLLHGTRPGTSGAVQRHAFDDALNYYYETEDKDKLRDYLRHETYHAVVGNPPYITVQDPMLRSAYRDRFGSASGKYQLGVPFTEKLFDLAIRGNRPGHIGFITAIAFAKRAFGRKLICEFFPKWDVTHIVDTSRAHIPDHATPTVILFGRNSLPVTHSVRVVRGIRGETREPKDPANAPVWRAIVAQIDHPGSRSSFVSTAEADRTSFYEHPWSIGGGGAAELKERLDETCEKCLRDLVSEIGVFGIPGADEAMIAQPRDFCRKSIRSDLWRPLCSGDDVRHWAVRLDYAILFPYSARLIGIGTNTDLLTWLWPLRTTLSARATFGGGTYRSEKRPWWGWHQLAFSRLRGPLLALAEIATHNNFVLRRGNEVFKQTAPVIKLHDNASESEHKALLGILNSSAVAFWLRQVC